MVEDHIPAAASVEESTAESQVSVADTSLVVGVAMNQLNKSLDEGNGLVTHVEDIG